MFLAGQPRIGPDHFTLIPHKVRRLPTIPIPAPWLGIRLPRSEGRREIAAGVIGVPVGPRPAGAFTIPGLWLPVFRGRAPSVGLAYKPLGDERKSCRVLVRRPFTLQMRNACFTSTFATRGSASTRERTAARFGRNALMVGLLQHHIDVSSSRDVAKHRASPLRSPHPLPGHRIGPVFARRPSPL